MVEEIFAPGMTVSLVARQHGVALHRRPPRRIGRLPLPYEGARGTDQGGDRALPTSGYRRVQAILKRKALAAGLKPPNHQRIYRVMKVHGLLLDRHAGGAERRHDGRIAVDERNRRWCSDIDRLRQWRESAGRLCARTRCDREAMSFLATTGGISGDDVRT